MKKRMPKLRMEWCYYNHDGKQEKINIRNIEADDYKAKYKKEFNLYRRV